MRYVNITVLNLYKVLHAVLRSHIAALYQILRFLGLVFKNQPSYLRQPAPKGSTVKVHDGVLAVTVPGVGHEGVAAALTAEERIKVITDGKTVGDDGYIQVTGAKEAVIQISAATNFVAYED